MIGYYCKIQNLKSCLDYIEKEHDMSFRSNDDFLNNTKFPQSGYISLYSMPDEGYNFLQWNSGIDRYHMKEFYDFENILRLKKLETIIND